MSKGKLVFDTPRQKAEYVKELTGKRITETEDKLRGCIERKNNTQARFQELTLKTNLMLHELAKAYLEE